MLPCFEKLLKSFVCLEKRIDSKKISRNPLLYPTGTCWLSETSPESSFPKERLKMFLEDPGSPLGDLG